MVHQSNEESRVNLSLADVWHTRAGVSSPHAWPSVGGASSQHIQELVGGAQLHCMILLQMGQNSQELGVFEQVFFPCDDGEWSGGSGRCGLIRRRPAFQMTRWWDASGRGCETRL